MDEQRKVQSHPFSEKSYLDNVTQFIKQVVPQVVSSLPSAPAPQPIEPVLDTPAWAAFDESGAAEDASTRIPPCLLVGYRNGLHVWDIREETKVELVSLRESTIVCAKILTPPQGIPDGHAGVRPLLAFVDADRPAIVQLYSLRSLEVLPDRITMPAPVLRILSTPRAIAIGTRDHIRLISSAALDQIAEFTGYPLSTSATQPNPFALTSRFLAFCTPEIPETDEFGVGEQSASMAAVVEMAQKTGSSLLSLGGYGVKKVSDMVNGPVPGHAAAPAPADGTGDEAAGNVMIVDVRDGSKLCHFRAAHRTPLVALAFDSSGTMLATACAKGQEINVFHLGMVPPNPGSAIGVVHLYTCRRGVTTANIRSITFSIDSRWMAVTSDRSTTHLFPLLPRGGQPTPRTHVAATVLNASRFVISSGANEAAQASPAVYVEALLKLRHAMPAAADPAHHTPAPLICSSACAFSVRQALEPETQSSSLAYTLLVCTPAAELVEYQLHPEVTQAPGRGALMGLVPASATGVMNTMGTVFEGVRGMVANVVGRAPEAPLPAAAPAPSDQLALSYSAGRAWDLCRHRAWPATRKATRSRTRDRPPATAGAAAAAAAAAVRDARAEAESDTRWLSAVERTTYNAPHRRLWMGPQFTFKIFRDPGLTSATIAAQSTTHGAGEAPVVGDLYTRKLQLATEPLLIPSEPRREDSELSVTWTEVPQTHALSDHDRLDLSSALEDEDSLTGQAPPARPAAAAAAAATSDRCKSRKQSAHASHGVASHPVAAAAAASPSVPRAVPRAAPVPTLPTAVLLSTSPPAPSPPLFSSSGSPQSARSSRARASTTLPTAAPAAVAPGSSLPRMLVGSPPGLALGLAKSPRAPSQSPATVAALARPAARIESTPTTSKGSPKGLAGSPSPDDLQGPLAVPSRGRTGLAIVLGDADSDARMQRVHSAVGLGGLADAISDDDDDDEPFRMDDHQHVD